MDERMINAWDSLVDEKDTIYVLGDVSFHPLEKTLSIMERLPGRKILIEGNHDRKLLRNDRFRNHFEGIHKLIDIKLLDKWIVLCHYPISSWNRKFHGALHLHGHSHGTAEKMTRRIDVGVDTFNFKPVHGSYLV